MKVLLEIKDNKAAVFIEFLKSLSYVKAEPISNDKALFLKELREAVKEVALAKKGKLKLQSAKDFLNEL
jgi:hypothetical protein